MFRVGSAVFLRNTKCLETVAVKRCLAAAATQPKQAAKHEEKDRQNLSFMANLFRGEIQTAEIFPYPEALDAEQKETIGMMVDPVTRFFTDVNDPVKNDNNAECDPATLDALWDLGGLSMQVPVEYGGMGMNNTQFSRLGAIVGANDLGVGVILGAHQSIGFKGILLYGTKEQKDKYLPRVSITGKTFAAFCLTEPGSGSDASSIKTRAVKSDCGKYYILNGSKIWISNGGVADIMTVFAKTEIEDPKTGKKKDKITAFIVERGFGGVTNGPAESKMGIKCSNTAEVYYDNVQIPIENVLGEEGEGFKVAMNILNNGRFGMAGTLSGTMKACIAKTADFAANRNQFNNKIMTYGAIQEKIGRMAMLQYASESMAFHVAGNMDLGSQDYHLEAAISKVFSSESAWNVCDEAIQAMGGMGFMKETGLEKVLRDIRIFRIFEGTNDILRLFVALTGIQYAGSHLQELQRAFKNPAANLGLIVKESSRRAFRSVGIGGSDLSPYVHPSLQNSAKLAAESVDLYGQAVEKLIIKYKKDIVNQQFLLNRLADAAIDIYAMVVTLSRATRTINANLPSAEYETLLTKNWCIEGSSRVKVNLDKIESGQFGEFYSNLRTVSNQICEANGVLQYCPLDV